MINRILIRIKVIQILYSYLLTREEFSIESPSDNISKDKKYSYTIYFDLLLLILRLSGYNIGNNSNGIKNNLSDNSLAKILLSNDEIRAIIVANSHNLSYYDDIILSLNNAIISSSIYKDYLKSQHPTIDDDVKFWSVVIKSIIIKNNLFIEASRKNDLFTINGFEAGCTMVINTLNEINDNKTSLYNAKNALTTSLNKSYELYFCIFNLMIGLTNLQTQQIEAAKNKHLPSVEDLNPNTRFIDNKFINEIKINSNFEEGLSKTSINWIDEPILLQNILNSIISSDIYTKYMSKPTNSIADDCEFWKNILKNIIFNNDDFNELLESKSAYWNDDLHIIGTFVFKTIKQYANNPGVELLPIKQYKDIEDSQFGLILFDETIKNFELYQSYINKFICKHWDFDRLAFMDIVVMTTAIAEMIKFPLIPIPVTLNEYIEIANSYSTAKSGQFINGILYSVINFLKSEGLLNK